jgi:hypothetical protein
MMKILLVVLLGLAVGATCFALGAWWDSEIQTIPPCASDAPAPVRDPTDIEYGPRQAADPYFVYGPRQVIPQVPPPRNMAEPDMEVCRSINTTCAGFWAQEKCTKSASSWTALLTESQVNCVVAAQGLAQIGERASWLRSCGLVACNAPAGKL